MAQDDNNPRSVPDPGTDSAKRAMTGSKTDSKTDSTPPTPTPPGRDFEADEGRGTRDPGEGDPKELKELNESSFAALSERRAIVYAWFADLLAAELELADLENFAAGAHGQVEKMLEQYDPENARAFFDAVRAVPRTTGDSIDLKSDFATCFLLGDKSSAPPYASAHLDGRGRLVGRTCERIREILEKRRLKVDPSFKEPEDHVSIILATMADRVAADGPLGYARAAPDQARLLDELLLSWIPEWADKVARMDAIHPVYPALVKLLLGTLRTDRSYLGD